MKVEREQALAFRLNSHNLARRLPPGSLLQAAASGAQNTPPGSAALAINARVEGLVPEEIERALELEKTLLQAWSLRASPYIFPTGDAAVFTLGLLPTDETDILHFIYGVKQALERIGIGAGQVVSLAAAGLKEILDGRSLTKDELGVALAEWILPRLPPEQQGPWQTASWYAPGQSLGESVARFALPVAALQGVCCHGKRLGQRACFVRTDQWLGRDAIPAIDGAMHDQARAGLVRTYLHYHGPSTPQLLAAWAGIAPTQAARSWQLVEAELLEVDLEGKPAWLLQGDSAALSSPPAAEGCRFLPPHDPLLDLRDRQVLFPDPALQRQVWRVSGNPGVLLAQGHPAGLWRPQKHGKRLILTITPTVPLSPNLRAEIEAEAASLAPFRGCREVGINYPA